MKSWMWAALCCAGLQLNMPAAYAQAQAHEQSKAQSQAQPKYTIQGTLSNAPTGSEKYIYFSSPRGTDSVRIEGDRFQIQGTGTPGQQIYIFKEARSRFEPETVASVYLGDGPIQVRINYLNFSDNVVKGSKAHEEYMLWKTRTREQDEALKPLNASYSEMNNAFITLRDQQQELEQQIAAQREKLEALRGEMNVFSEKITEKVPAFIRDFPNSAVSADLLFGHLTRFSLEEAEGLYNVLGPLAKETRAAKMAAEKLASIKGASAGSVAAVFTTKDIDGEPLSLTDFRGQYVLLDFWASWCVPCRKGNPHLIELHNKYHKQGFEIIGISDDDSNHAAWKKAVADDQIGIWKHVLRGLKRSPNGGYDKSEDISEPYGISTLPTKILIDPNGVIIGRYGSNGGTDADLDKKLAKIFN